MECDRTASLETSPGHVTRCADTPYVTAFEEARQRLAESRRHRSGDLGGAGAAQPRAAAHRRARACAATRRRPARGRRAGAARRGHVHARPGRDAAFGDHQRRRAARGGHHRGHAAARGPSADDSGAGGDRRRAARRSPSSAWPASTRGAGDLDAFWSNVVGGVDAVTEVPAERWDTELYYDPEATARPRGHTPSKWGGFLPQVPFDALAYGIPPRVAGQHRARPAPRAGDGARARSRDAGYADRAFDRERTSVIFGAEAGSDLSTAYGLRSALPTYTGEVPPALDEQLPRLTEDSFPGVLSQRDRRADREPARPGRHPTTPWTRPARRASPRSTWPARSSPPAPATWSVRRRRPAQRHPRLSAVRLGARAVAAGPVRDVRLRPPTASRSARAWPVSCSSGWPTPNATATACTRSSRASAGSSDGRSLGLTAPRPEGQRRALERAYAASRRSPRPTSAWWRRTGPAPSSATVPSWPRSPTCSSTPAPPPGAARSAR